MSQLANVHDLSIHYCTCCHSSPGRPWPIATFTIPSEAALRSCPISSLRNHIAISCVCSLHTHKGMSEIDRILGCLCQTVSPTQSQLAISFDLMCGEITRHVTTNPTAGGLWRLLTRLGLPAHMYLVVKDAKSFSKISEVSWRAQFVDCTKTA
jgi:hypothetical protein